MEKNLFTKEEFFSGHQNLKILLLCKLYEKGKIQKNEEEYYENIEHLITDIRKEIDGEIKKKKLEEFLKNDESFIKQRLSLINLILYIFNPDEEYIILKNKIKEINDDIEKLKYIKDNIIIYYPVLYEDIIKRSMKIIKDNQNKKIIDYKGGKIKELIKESENLKDLADKINEVKDLLLFNIIYDMNSGKNEEKKFKFACDKLDDIGKLIRQNTGIIELYNEYKEIFDKIKEKLSNNEERAQEFIQKLKEYYKITNENIIDELTILFKIKKYELDINSNIFFFEYFEKDNSEWNKKITEYQDLSKKGLKEIKKNLKELKDNNIYDYKDIKKYNKLFTCLYNKKEAIDFLFSKTSKDIEDLKDKIQPTDRTINYQDIIDTENCIEVINKMKDMKDNDKIFTYIKSMNDNNIISQFENYSKIYLSVIELDRNDDISENVYGQINNIIKSSTFTIFQDSEKFLYYDEEKKYKKITMEELIHLKNKIYNVKENDDDKSKNNVKINDNDKLKSKCKILIDFKNIISNLETINKYMNILRSKGSSLPIKITITIKTENNKLDIKYCLDKNVMDFEDIRDFLFNVKTKYIS